LELCSYSMDRLFQDSGEGKMISYFINRKLQ
jgi:hypothetical protein